LQRLHDTLITGAMGFMDRNGWIKLVDRKKDMILESGFNVHQKRSKMSRPSRGAASSFFGAAIYHAVLEGTRVMIGPRNGAASVLMPPDETAATFVAVRKSWRDRCTGCT
jgi:hypothetical protein